MNTNWWWSNSSNLIILVWIIHTNLKICVSKQLNELQLLKTVFWFCFVFCCCWGFGVLFCFFPLDWHSLKWLKNRHNRWKVRQILCKMSFLIQYMHLGKQDLLFMVLPTLLGLTYLINIYKVPCTKGPDPSQALQTTPKDK